MFRLGPVLVPLVITSFGLVHASTLTARQAQTGSLNGVVIVEGTVTPVADAVITAGGVYTVRSDADGRFVVRRPNTNAFTLVVRALGFAPQTIRVTAEHVGSQPLRVALVRQPVRLAAVQVLRERTQMGSNLFELPGSAHVLNRDTFGEHLLLVDDVHQVLRAVPGVNVQEEDGFGLRPNIGLRGSGSERSSKITLMEDGVLIAPAPYAAPSAYYFPVAGRMEAVEVRKGSSQIKYGPRTVGGAVNLISTAIPDRFTAAADVVGGDNATTKTTARVGTSTNHVGAMVEAYRSRSGGFKEIDGGAGDTGYDIANYVGKLRFNTSDRAPVYQEIEFKFGHYDETSDETYLGLTDLDFALNPVARYPASRLDVMNARHRQLQARYFVRPSDRVDVTVTAYDNDFTRNWYKLQRVLDRSLAGVLRDPIANAEEYAVLTGADSGDDALVIRANNRSYYSRGVQSVLGVRLESGTLEHQLEIGARYHADQEDRLQWEDGFRMDTGVMVQTSAGEPGSQSNRVSDARALSFFLQDEIVAGRWTVTPGVRFESVDLTRTDYAGDDPNRVAPTRVREHSVGAWIPGVGASYRFAPTGAVFAGVHRGFAPPGPGADPETRPEKSVNYELGARVVTPRVHAEVIGFFTDYTNVLGAATLATAEDGTGDQFNGGAVHTYGIEALVQSEAKLRSGAVRVPVRLAVTYTHAAFQSSFDSDFGPWGRVEAGDELPYVPTWQLHGSAGLTGSRWAVDLTGSYTGRMRTVAGSGGEHESETDPALVFSSSATYEIGPAVDVFVAAQNVLDDRYIVARRPAGVRPGLPRTMSAGVRFRP